MKLLIDPTNGRVVSEQSGEELKREQFYDIPGSEHQVIIRTQSRHLVLLHLMTNRKDGRKRKLVQSGRIQLLSAVAGRESHTGAPRPHLYQVELDPNRPIWPIASLVDQLMQMGVDDWQITPMNPGATLNDNCAARSDPQMLTDGQLMQTPNPGGDPHGFAGEDLLPGVDFTVKDASWAILYFPDGIISHIYLWPDAANKADEIMSVVQRMIAAEEAAEA